VERWFRYPGFAAAALVVIGTVAFLLAVNVQRPAARRVVGGAPAGQPPVSLLTVDGFRRAFNAADRQTRLLVMFSPT